MVWSKLNSPFRMAGRYQNEDANSLVNKSNINEEYMEALRTKSYTDICRKVQRQLRRTIIHRPSSSSSSLSLSECLLEPQQETITHIIERSNLHHLLVDYFDASLEAYKICELLLPNVQQTRANYSIIRMVIEQTETVHEQYLFEDLAQFGLLKNPLSQISPVQFQNIHDTHKLLLHKLTFKYKIKKRTKFYRFCKEGVESIACCYMGKRTLLKTSSLERVGAQIDGAAKGVYTLINDFDTVSRLVRSLHDEMEHYKVIAGVCVRNGKREVLKEVLREFRIRETCFLEQLEELEEHIYLCFLNINRSRRLVVQEIMALQSESILNGRL